MRQTEIKRMKEIMKDVIIKQGDCLELLKDIPDKSINLILCDLPYGETGNKWDKRIDLSRLFKEYRRIIKNDGCIALNGSFKFGVRLYNEAPDLYKYLWIWEKPHGSNVPLIHHQPWRNFDFILIFSKGGASSKNKISMKYNPQMFKGKRYTQKKEKKDKYRKNWNSGVEIKESYTTDLRYPLATLKFDFDKKKYHGTQKPVKLCEYIIKTYTDEGDTVLDNCMGSGSTGIACQNTNRKFIGYELDEELFEITKQRLEENDERLKK